MRVFASGLTPDLRQGVVVTALNSTTLDVALSAPGAVSGVVTASSGGAALAGAAVTVFDGATPVGTTQTDGAGAYTPPAGFFGLEMRAALAPAHRCDRPHPRHTGRNRAMTWMGRLPRDGDHDSGSAQAAITFLVIAPLM